MSERVGASETAFWGEADDAEALQRYRTLVNVIDDGIYQLDAEGRFVAVNDIIVELSGYARDELLGAHVSLLLDADNIATIEREIKRRLAGGDDRRETFEFAVQTADGDRIPCELRLNLLVEDGAFRGTIGVVRDVSDRKRAERTLTQRDRQLARESGLTDRILETSPVGIMVLDGDGEVARINERAGEILGIPEREREAFDPGDRPTYDEYGNPIPTDEHPFAQALETGEPVYDRVLQVERPDGTQRWLSVSAAPILTADGEVDYVVTTGEDVTAIKERERELENELSEIFGRVTDAFYALDDRWRITYANERAEELIDYTGDGLVGENFWEVFEWATDSKPGAEYRTAMETQEPTSFEFYYPRPLEAWYEVHVYPSETGLSVYFRDVTDRKRRERALEESERRYRTLVEHFPNGAVALVDEGLNYRTVGGKPIAASTSVDDLESQPIGEALPPELADELVPRYEAALGGESSTFEAEIDDRIYHIHIVPVRDEDDGVFAALGMSQDVTERKENQRKLAESERRYRTLVEHFPNGAVGLFDEDLRYTAAGGKAFDDIGDSTADVVGRTVRDRYPDELAAQLEPKFRATLDGETNAFEFEYHGRHWLAYTVPIGDAEGDSFAGMVMVQDVTERTEYERKLAESERRYRTLAECFPNGIVTLFDHDLEYTLAAGQGFDDIPVDPEEVEGASFRAIWGGETVDALEPVFEATLDGEERSVELRYAGREWMIHTVPVADERGDVFAGMTMAQDITEQVERERKLEEAVEQLEESNDRLESFASLLAHELRNPVTIGQIYGQQLPDDTDSEAVEYVTEAFDRIEAMIDVMLVLTRGREAVGQSSPLALADVAREAWSEVDAPDATLAVELDDVMRADETYVRHLFRNLFENAVQHGDANATVRVGALPDGFYVADDGVGVPADDREKVFEAGFTTAASTGGTGLGLAFVEELAEVYEWTCRVTESAGGGARFEFRNVEFVSTE